MPLSCSCESDEAEWWSWNPEDYSTMPERRRRCRCSSCGALIAAGSVVAKFERTRYARGYVEEAVYGEGPDAVPLADWYLCERCADLWFSLYELGFECVLPDENMRDLVREYAALAAEQRHANPA